MTKIIGIDLGTSNSAASVVLGGKPTIIPAAEGATVGGKAFPSVVAFSKSDELLVGEPARRQAVTNPDSTIVAAKRKMGSDHIFKILDKEYKPQQISAYILQKIKKDAEAFIGESVENASETLSEVQMKEERVQLAIRRREGVALSDLPHEIPDELTGLVNVVGENLVLTKEGRLLANEVTIRLL